EVVILSALDRSGVAVRGRALRRPPAGVRGHFMVIACVVQASSHALQSMQSSSLTTAMLLSLTAMAADGQTSSQDLQPEHSSASTTAGMRISFWSRADHPTRRNE